jgi:hypothetical protein
MLDGAVTDSGQRVPRQLAAGTVSIPEKCVNLSPRRPQAVMACQGPEIER